MIRSRNRPFPVVFWTGWYPLHESSFVNLAAVRMHKRFGLTQHYALTLVLQLQQIVEQAKATKALAVKWPHTQSPRSEFLVDT